VFSAAGSAIFFPLALTIGNATWMTLLLAAGIFLLALPIGCSYAALQLIFPNQMRGQMSALFLFIMSFGGVTLGPLLPGLLNDYFFRSEKMLGASMALTIGAASLLMWSSFLAAYRPYREDYRAAQSSQSG
jgi:MFS family permease